jgi:hypothetical protein
LTTVLRKVQLFRRKVGYCPTTYMMQEAMTALFSLPFLTSQSWRRVLRVEMKKALSSLSWMLPQREPTIQDREFKVSKLKY